MVDFRKVVNQCGWILEQRYSASPQTPQRPGVNFQGRFREDSPVGTPDGKTVRAAWKKTMNLVDVSGNVRYQASLTVEKVVRGSRNPCPLKVEPVSFLKRHDVDEPWRGNT